MKTILDDSKPGVNKFLIHFSNNKCCIFSLLLLTVLIFLVIGAKIWINAILDEVEENSDPFSFRGLNNSKNEFEYSEKYEETRKQLPSYFSGFDYFNRPVWIMPFGQWDVKGLLNARPENEKLMRMVVTRRGFELEESLKLRNSSQWVIICDMADYSYTQLTSLKTIKFLIQILKKQDSIFSILAYGFAVNLDSFSHTFANLMAPVVGSTVASKIEIMGRDQDKFIPAILKKIPAHQLPPQYGGLKNHRPLLTV